MPTAARHQSVASSSASCRQTSAKRSDPGMRPGLRTVLTRATRAIGRPRIAPVINGRPIRSAPVIAEKLATHASANKDGFRTFASATEVAPSAESYTATPRKENKDAPTFQQAIQRLQDYWAEKGCCVFLPHNTEVRIYRHGIKQHL